MKVFYLFQLINKRAPQKSNMILLNKMICCLNAHHTTDNTTQSTDATNRPVRLSVMYFEWLTNHHSHVSFLLGCIQFIWGMQKL